MKSVTLNQCTRMALLLLYSEINFLDFQKTSKAVDISIKERNKRAETHLGSNWIGGGANTRRDTPTLTT